MKIKRKLLQFLSNKKTKYVLLAIYLFVSLIVSGIMIWSYNYGINPILQKIAMVSFVVWAILMAILLNIHDLKCALLDRVLDSRESGKVA